MPNFIRFAGIVIVTGSIAWACSGGDSTQASNGSGGGSGTATGGAGIGAGAAGSDATSGGSAGSGSSTGPGGAAGSGSSTGGSGGSSSAGGAGGAAGASAGAGGASVSALGCAKDEDCIVAYGHSNKGCCFRGCGSAYNRDYVAAEPCVSANAMTDPVPTSCDTGCLQCPGSQCQQVFGAICLAGQCTSVTQFSPCATDSDCVVAVDYASEQGGCCSCPEITTKHVLASDRCVVLKGQPKPDVCVPAATFCNMFGCPAQCPNPTVLKCDKGICMGS